MLAWEQENFDQLDCGRIDKVIALKFPAFYLKHHSLNVWLTHQHRSVYELFDTPHGDRSNSSEAVKLKSEVIRRDTEALSGASKVFTISPTVSERLLKFNKIHSEPLLQPPPHAEKFYSAELMPYIFVPSRLESLKRQELLIRAMPMVKEPVFAIIAGEGGDSDYLHRITRELRLEHRVRFIGRVGDAEMLSYYANALGIFFGPLLEDYGFVTLEAMLSSRAVITCRDSGCPTFFIRDGETGFVTEPMSGCVADAINQLWADRGKARRLGRNGRDLYDSLEITWDHIVASLLTK
jgi:glycosyltransferase involved in cell wall biosynthesis